MNTETFQVHMPYEQVTVWMFMFEAFGTINGGALLPINFPTSGLEWRTSRDGAKESCVFKQDYSGPNQAYEASLQAAPCG